MNAAAAIALDTGATSLGIEFGSTRVKAVLMDDSHAELASASHAWESVHENGYWTYGFDAIDAALSETFEELSDRVHSAHGVDLRTIGSIGISGMMHGYIALGPDGTPLVPFRTWRNTVTSEASSELTELLDFHVPQRWTVAHYRQAMLNGETHVAEVDQLTTLSGYVHWRLTGEHVVGIGEGSGIFPVDDVSGDYDPGRLRRFDALVEGHVAGPMRDLLPRIAVAGQEAGRLTTDGAALLDPSGRLQPGVAFSPPEGDAGTGMVATNSIAARTANISAGTSAFAMIVLETPLSSVHEEVDVVATPTGAPVAMVHSNNCTADLDEWVGLFREFSSLMGHELDDSELFRALLGQSLSADPDGGGLLIYNFVSGEHVVDVDPGRPLLVRTERSRFNLANLMRTHLFAALAGLRLGFDTLFESEPIAVDRVFGHGGFFKTGEVGERIMAAATGLPISIMTTAGEGGAWGSAILASFLRQRRPDEQLADFLEQRVFADVGQTTTYPDPSDQAGFEAFMARYRDGLEIERTAAQLLT